MEDPTIRAETRQKTIDLFRLVDRGGCRHRALLRYFDEELEACGESCDVCRGATIEEPVATQLHVDANRFHGALGGSAPAAVRTRQSPGLGRGVVPDVIANPELFQRLRELRKRIANAEGVPAYIVFSDAVLRQMSAVVPRTRAELLGISGVGPVKLERYGDPFLEVLREG
jgi:superfamily II DNA helicase RecQ